MVELLLIFCIVVETSHGHAEHLLRFIPFNVFNVKVNQVNDVGGLLTSIVIINEKSAISEYIIPFLFHAGTSSNFVKVSLL